MFRPFIAKKRNFGFSAWSASAKTPASVFDASVVQLKGLVLDYSSNHMSSTYSSCWHTGLLYLANAALKNTENPDWRFYFLLCIQNYQNLYLCFRAFGGIVQSLLVMAVDSGKINGSEAQIIIEEMLAKSPGHYGLGKKIGGFMVDLDLAVTDPEAGRIDSLIEKFQEIATFDEFTDGVV